MSSFLHRLQKNASLIEASLEQWLPEAEAGADRILREAMRYSTLAGGKRLRGHLILEFCALCGGDPEAALPYAAGMEMIQAFSLIHDDLPCMDNDTLRRGKPTNHVVYGESTALLAGDALALLAPEVLASNPHCTPLQNLEAVKLLTRKAGALGMCGGQQIDLQSENKTIPREELEELVAKKCGALFEASCELGCIAADGGEEARRNASLFGAYTGLAFQVADDLLDLRATAEVLGKTPGKDEKSGKSTFVSLLGIEGAEAFTRGLCEKAKEILSLFPAGEAGESLAAFCDFIISRNY